MPAELEREVVGEREFELFQQAFDLAAERAGGVLSVPLNVAGYKVSLDFAGPALMDRMARPFRHLAAEGEPEMRFQCWDSESTGVPFPEEVDFGLVRRDSLPGLYRDTTTRWTSERPDPGLSGYHRASSRAIYYLKEASGMTYGDLAGGLRAAFTWAMADRGLLFLHTAAVGWEGRGALIVGASGAGKSSTALTCLLGGLQFLGDDHCLVSREAPRTVHAVYAAAKLHSDQMVRFPDLLPLIVNHDRDPLDKAVAILQPHFQPQLPRTLPVDALFVPKVTERRETTIEPLSRAAAMFALAPSTVLQMTGVEPDGLAAMASLVRSVPCYQILLGWDRAIIAQVVRDFLVSGAGR